MNRYSTLKMTMNCIYNVPSSRKKKKRKSLPAVTKCLQRNRVVHRKNMWGLEIFKTFRGTYIQHTDEPILLTSSTKDHFEGMLLPKEKVPKNKTIIILSDDTGKSSPYQEVLSKNHDRIGYMCENMSDMDSMISSTAETVEICQKRVQEVTKNVNECKGKLVNVLANVKCVQCTGIMMK